MRRAQIAPLMEGGEFWVSCVSTYHSTGLVGYHGNVIVARLLFHR